MRRGSNVDPGLSHRCLLDLAPGLRSLPDGALYHRIGGQLTVDRLVDSLYDRFEADAVIRPFFGRDLANGRNRQKRFFAEWLGGPPRYSESAWGALYQHHEDLPITRAVAERWLDLSTYGFAQIERAVAFVKRKGVALDVGCGAGRCFDLLARHGFATDGIDSSPAMIALARERHP